MTTPAATAVPRVLQTPEFEPLIVAPEDRASSVVDLIHRSVERNSGREAMRWKLPKSQRPEGATEAVWTSRTYREMWDWVTSVSLGLKDIGIHDGDSVAIIARTRPEWAIADLASLALGAVTCPIYPQSEAGQAAFVINNVSARLIFVENAQQAAKIESIRAECPTLEHVVAFEPSGKLPAGTLTLDDVMARADTHAANRLVNRHME